MSTVTILHRSATQKRDQLSIIEFSIDLPEYPEPLEEIYQEDAHKIRKALMSTVPSGTWDALLNLLRYDFFSNMK